MQRATFNKYNSVINIYTKVSDKLIINTKEFVHILNLLKLSSNFTYHEEVLTSN
jgi:hypothetical protein